MLKLEAAHSTKKETKQKNSAADEKVKVQQDLRGAH